MNYKAAIIALAICALFTGCDSNPVRPEQAAVSVNVNTEKSSPRFTVVLVGEFYDVTAYGNFRRIYEITDNKTKITYLSVSGLSLDRQRHNEDVHEAVETMVNALETMNSFSD